jgi:hypothetical protein
MFLKDKLYADFRTDFDRGLKTILEATARVTSEGQGRLESPEWNIDWAIDWGMRDERFWLRFTAVEQAKDQPYSVLCEINAFANDTLTERYLLFERNRLDWIEREAVLTFIGEGVLGTRAHFFNLEDQFPKTREGLVRDTKRGVELKFYISARRMGADNGKDVLFDYGEQLRQVLEQQRQMVREPNADENARIKEFLRGLP